MAKERKKLGGTGEPPKPPPAPKVRRVSTAWPPVEFDVQATLVQPACVKCRRPEFKVRLVSYEGQYRWKEDAASVCDPCWAAVIGALDEYDRDLVKAFWAAGPVPLGPKDQPVDLVDFKPHKKTSALWKDFLYELKHSHLKLRR